MLRLLRMLRLLGMIDEFYDTKGEIASGILLVTTVRRIIEPAMRWWVKTCFVLHPGTPAHPHTRAYLCTPPEPVPASRIRSPIDASISMCVR